jgi:hypothetical protein
MSETNSSQVDIAALTAPVYGDDAAKKKFHRVADKYVRRLAKALGLPEGGYDIRHNQGGSAVSGEITLHAEHLHLWVQQFSTGPRDRIVCYRGCASRTDYTGYSNHYATAQDLVDTKTLARRSAVIMEQAVARNAPADAPSQATDKATNRPRM